MASPAKKKTTAAAAAASSPSPAAAAAGASSVEDAASFLALPSPASSFTSCRHPASSHVRLPHLDERIWREVVQKLEPMASYYVEFVQPAKRGTGQTGAATGKPTRNNNKEAPAAASDNCIWRSHYVPSGLPSPPVYPSGTCVAFLQSVRHPSSRGKYSGKSLVSTLDSVLDPLDRDHFFQVLLPFLCYLAMQLPTHFPPGQYCLPLLMRGVSASVTLSAGQCATLLACQALSLFDEGARGDTYPAANFDAFFTATRAPMSGKHILVFNYLARIEDPNEGIPSRFITFHRRVCLESVSDEIDELASVHARTPLVEAEYREDGCIEDATHSLQADFANKYLGGGVLYTGCVQEEIRFCLSPECIVGMLLCEVMDTNEAVVLIGPGMYSHYSGYGTDLKFGRDLADEGLPLDEYGRKSNCIVAVDAIDFCSNEGSERRGPQTQWTEEAMARETLKSYVGFSFEQAHLGERFRYASVATGNWGCGAFGGFVPLKFLLQWLACSLADRKLIYYSFGNPLAKSIPGFVRALKDNFGGSGAKGGGTVTVGEMYAALQTVAPKYEHGRKEDATPDGLFRDILQVLKANKGTKGGM